MNTILITAFVIMGFMLPVFFCGGFYYGFGTAENVFCHRNVGAENIPGNTALQAVKSAVSGVRHRETDAQRQTRILAENVENFGTGVPQQEVI